MNCATPHHARAIRAAPMLVAAFGSVAAMAAEQQPGIAPTPQTKFSKPYWNSRPAYEVKGKQNGRLMKMFFGCLYKSSPEELDDFLASTDISGAIPVPTPALTKVTQRCADRAAQQMHESIRGQFPGTVYRSFVAEEAYLKKNEVAAVLPTDATEFLDRKPVVPGNVTAQTLMSMADCVVYRDTAGTDAVLRVLPGSGEERDAVAALVPAISQCIADGQTFKITPQSIRSLAADGLWARYAKTEH